MAFLLFTLAIIGLGIFVRVFWFQLLILGMILGGILGVLICSAITALCFSFFAWFLSQGESYGSIGTYFQYSLVVYTVGAFVYMSIVSDIIKMGWKYIRYIFGKRY